MGWRARRAMSQGMFNIWDDMMMMMMLMRLMSLIIHGVASTLYKVHASVAMGGANKLEIQFYDDSYSFCMGGRTNISFFSSSSSFFRLQRLRLPLQLDEKEWKGKTNKRKKVKDLKTETKGKEAKENGFFSDYSL